jgi:hypothetical protein
VRWAEGVVEFLESVDVDEQDADLVVQVSSCEFSLEECLDLVLVRTTSSGTVRVTFVWVR